MRPDEHKKKKNADYKKKHGICSSKASKKDEPKKNKSQGSEKHEPEPSSMAAISHGQEANCFSKRKIQSNWTRYDEPIDSFVSTERRGGDFSTLLESAGDSYSQFRFQDEKDWDEDEPQQPSQFGLQINFQELSDSLLSLPMYKRLDIQDLRAGRDYTWKQKETSTTNKNNSSSKIIRNYLPQEGFKTGNASYTVNESINKEMIEERTINFTPRLESKSELSSNIPNKIESDVDLLDDELDILLSLDDKKTDNEHVKDTKQELQQPNVNKVEFNEPNTKSLLEKNEKQKDENLEDWLDSVLGS